MHMLTFWIKSSFEAARACQEIQEVICWRMIKLARGDMLAIERHDAW
jgi:hypothetical protein